MEKFFEDLISQNPQRFYPDLKIDHIQNPNRFYAIPILGGLFKIIILLPVAIEVLLLVIFWIFISFINSLIVLFTGKYWNFAYQFSIGIFRLFAKIDFYFSGLSNKYPGFSFKSTEFILNINKPEKPNRLFAFPILGGLARAILLIPYYLWNQVLSNSAGIGIIIASFPVLFKGSYPESIYELNKDNIRISFGYYSYMSGLSDTYPSFWISFNHKTIKILLLVVGIILTLNSSFGNYNGLTAPKPLPTEPVACTADAKECPNGTFVGRIPPSCAFAICPIQ